MTSSNKVIPRKGISPLFEDCEGSRVLDCCQYNPRLDTLPLAYRILIKSYITATLTNHTIDLPLSSGWLTGHLL